MGFSRCEKPKINCSGAARSNLEIIHSDFCCVLQQIILYTACGHLTCAALSFIVEIVYTRLFVDGNDGGGMNQGKVEQSGEDACLSSSAILRLLLGGSGLCIW